MSSNLQSSIIDAMGNEINAKSRLVSSSVASIA